MSVLGETMLIFRRAMRLSLRNPVPMSLAPAWLRVVSDVNPMKHVVDGVRALFLGHVATGVVFWGAFATVALAVAGVALGTRTFQRESS